MEIIEFTHDYLVCIRRILPEEGGGYISCIPQLGSACFNGIGETPDEALNDLQLLYEELLPIFEKDKDWNYPEPKDENNIEWNDKPKPDMEEVNRKFAEYLHEAEMNLYKGSIP